MPAKLPISHPHDLVWALGEQPSSTRLRHRSADVAAVFLYGYSQEQIAVALHVDVELIADSIRWEMKRRDRRAHG
jgi:hypothetical protein